MPLWKICGGTVYDPANGIDGEVRDLWISDGKIVAPPADPDVRPTRVLDATGLVVMPGGVDMHCHIAGPKVNVARKMRPEEKRKARRSTAPPTHASAARIGSVPSTFATGYKYAGHGLHHRLRRRHSAARRPPRPRGVRRHALHRQGLLTSSWATTTTSCGQIAAKEPREAAGLHRPGCSARPRATRASSSTPAASRSGSSGRRQRHGLDEHGRPLRRHAAADHQRRRPGGRSSCGLPHPVHIHCNNLGMPGNWTTTLETMKALEGHRGHLTHIQFHSYGGGDGRREHVQLARSPPLAEYVNAHPNLTVDVGQVLFGETTSMTGDGPLGYYLHNVYRPQVVQRRHRDGGRLRHRADQVQEQEPRPRPAMGDRAGVVPAGRRSRGGWR